MLLLFTIRRLNILLGPSGLYQFFQSLPGVLYQLLISYLTSCTKLLLGFLVIVFIITLTFGVRVIIVMFSVILIQLQIFIIVGVGAVFVSLVISFRKNNHHTKHHQTILQFHLSTIFLPTVTTIPTK